MLQERADFPTEEAEEDARGPRSGRVVQTSRGFALLISSGWRSVDATGNLHAHGTV